MNAADQAGELSLNKTENGHKIIEISDELITCAFSAGIAIVTFCGHLFLGVFFWCKTGTFPLRERLRNRVIELETIQHNRKSPTEESEHLTPQIPPEPEDTFVSCSEE